MNEKVKTAETSEKLAKRLESAGLKEMAEKARQNRYHDFFGESATPITDLVNDLAREVQKSDDPVQVNEMRLIRKAAIDGEFDATHAEAEEWAESDEGLAAVREIGLGS